MEDFLYQDGVGKREVAPPSLCRGPCRILDFYMAKVLQGPFLLTHMRKEAVRLNLDGVTNVLPYRDYYRGRNGLVAKYLARYLDLPYLDEMGRGMNEYVVPPVAITKEAAESLGIRTEADFYGGAVEHMGHISKAILHPSISSSKPSFYSDIFAKSVEGLVLPGVTAFSKQDLLDNYDRLAGQFPLMRLKFTNKSDGHGQFQVFSKEMLTTTLDEVSDEEVASDGLVIEPDLEHKSTISFGRVIVGTDTFYFLAKQKNDFAPEDSRDRYLGADVLIVRHDVRKLFETRLTISEQRSLGVGSEFLERYSYFDPICSRLSFDCLTGYDKLDRMFCGVTDITARLGGTCPALSLAIIEFKKNRDLSFARVEVNLNYDPLVEKDVEIGATAFIDLPSLRLTARINFIL